jgi:ABC-type tungstate transport system permease subunit
LDIGRRGDADVVMVHDKVAEEKFVSEGFAEKRIEVMYNDFVLIGPKADQQRPKARISKQLFKKSLPPNPPLSLAAIKAVHMPQNFATGKVLA